MWSVCSYTMINTHFEVVVNVTIFYEEGLPIIPSSFHLSEKKGGRSRKVVGKKIFGRSKVRAPEFSDPEPSGCDANLINAQVGHRRVKNGHRPRLQRRRKCYKKVTKRIGNAVHVVRM